MPRPSSRFLLPSARACGACAFLALLTLTPGAARAQTTPTIVIAQKDSLARVDGNGSGVGKRDSTISREGVNLTDCQADQSILFPITLSGFVSTDNTEVWATDQGADCADPVKRTQIPAACYPLKSANFVLTSTQTTSIKVKEMIRGTGDASTLDASGCRLLNLSTVTVYFLLFRGGNTTTALVKEPIPVKVDTIGPKPLSNVRAQAGNTRISIAWDSVGEGGTDDVTGVQAYCDPAPVPVGATDAGSSQVCVDADADDAGATPEPTCTTVATDGGTAGNPIPQAPNIDSNGMACSTVSFAKKSGKNIVPDAKFNSLYRCGSVTGTTGNTIVVGSASDGALVNARTYAVTVAATDSFDNVGEIADPICQFPEETSDFWREYRASGGEAGGGFCTVEGAGTPAGSFGLVMVAGGVAVSSMRRRAKRAEARREEEGQRSDR